MAKPSPRLLTVIRKQQLSNNMLRITLGGEDLKNFPQGQESGYVKLVFPSDDLSAKPLMRSYTIKSFDDQTLELVLDFVVHGRNGPASTWAMDAEVGTKILVAGPGDKKLVDNSADWFFIVGDLTALPAITVNLAQLPKDAVGYVVIEVIDETDQLNINVPEGIEVHWVINANPTSENTLLADVVKTLNWHDISQRVNVWVACEYSAMRALRQYFCSYMGVDRQDIYLSSYWKIGATDEGNKAAKRALFSAE